MLVVYESGEENEVIITSEDKEKAMLLGYFGKGNRDVEDYDRSIEDVIVVTTRMRVDTG